MKLEELKINEEYERALHPLTEEEYFALKESIKENGILSDLIINPENVILDGHHRYKIAQELNIKDVPVKIKSFKSPLDELEFVLTINYKRRHANKFQLAEAYLKLLEIEKQRAAKRKPGRGKKLAPNGADLVGKATEIVARKIGLSTRTLERALKVIKEGSETVKKKLRNEEWSINYAYQGYCLLDDVTDDEKKEELKDQFENEEITLQELNKIVQNTLVAYEWLGSTAPSISKELEEKYEDSFWTADLDLKQFEHDLKEKEGAPVPLKEVEIVSTKFQSRKDAEAFFKKCGGYLVGTRVYYVGKIDPLKYQE